MKFFESVSPDFLQCLIQSVNTGIVVTDATQPDNPIVFANDAFYSITGYTAEETIGFNCRFLQGADLQQEEIYVLKAAIKSGSHCKVTLRNYRKDGTPFWNELYVSPYFDKNGNLTHFIGVQHDVTDAVEQRLASNFVSGGLDSMLMPPMARERAYQHLRLHAVGCNHDNHVPCSDFKKSIAKLVDILNIQKSGSDELRPRLSVVKASELLQTAIFDSQASAKIKRVETNIIQLGGDYNFLADHSMVRRAIVSLLLLTINYSQPGKRIWLTSLANEIATMIAVIDEGSGLPAPIKRQTSIECSAASSIHQENSVSGTGLKDIAQIMQAHGGELSLIKSDYGGTEFALLFPRRMSSATAKLAVSKVQAVEDK